MKMIAKRLLPLIVVSAVSSCTVGCVRTSANDALVQIIQQKTLYDSMSYFDKNIKCIEGRGHRGTFSCEEAKQFLANSCQPFTLPETPYIPDELN